MNPRRHCRRTTPTWEVELLISGVAVFAMLQLPGWLDDGMFALEPRVGADWRVVLMLVYFYSKSAAVVLAVTFAAHVLLRAQWIALVGMDSVYPQGVRLDRMRVGPIQRAIEEARPDGTQDAIERADNRASVVFAIGVSVVAGYEAMRGKTTLGSYALFPRAESLRVDPAHYEDQRDPSRTDAVPYVQGTVVTGPYLKLVVPYRPRRDEPAMQRACADVQGTAPQTRDERRLACLSLLYSVSLNGGMLEDLKYEVASDPRTNRPALLSMIDVRALAGGRHELRVARPQWPGRKPERDKPDPGFHLIPFWN